MKRTVALERELNNNENRFIRFADKSCVPVVKYVVRIPAETKSLYRERAGRDVDAEVLDIVKQRSDSLKIHSATISNRAVRLCLFAGEIGDRIENAHFLRGAVKEIETVLEQISMTLRAVCAPREDLQGLILRSLKRPEYKLHAAIHHAHRHGAEPTLRVLELAERWV